MHEKFQNRPKGITVLGILFIVTSLWTLYNFLSYPYYQNLFHYLPDDVVLMRYIVSVTGRVLGLACGIGLLLSNNFSRVLAIFLCWINLCIIYWKHPIEVFYKIALSMEQKYYGTIPAYPTSETIAHNELMHPFFPWLTMYIFYAIDIIFGFAVIIYFSRLPIVSYFKK